VTGTELPEGARRVAAMLAGLGHPHDVVMLPVTGRTAADAAAALGVELGVSALVGKLGRAGADFVKAATGFSIGGVSPVAHTTPPVILIDAELFRFGQVWAAAGHPYAVFPLSPGELVQLTGAPVADIS